MSWEFYLQHAINEVSKSLGKVTSFKSLSLTVMRATLGMGKVAFATASSPHRCRNTSTVALSRPKPAPVVCRYRYATRYLATHTKRYHSVQVRIQQHCRTRSDSIRSAFKYGDGTTSLHACESCRYAGNGSTGNNNPRRIGRHCLEATAKDAPL